MTQQPSTEVTIVKIIGTKVWCESDILGDRHVMVQHEVEGEKPFCYATFHYDYRYTSNSGTRGAAEDLARRLGATGQIEWRNRPIELGKAMTHTTEQERAEFEAWAIAALIAKNHWEGDFQEIKKHLHGSRMRWSERLGKYLANDTQSRWEAWQAARRAPAAPVPQDKDRLLAALERATRAETALRNLIDESGNEMTPGWEERMSYCIALGNEILAAAPQPPEPTAHKQLEDLQSKVGRIGLDIDRAMRGDVNDQSPIATRLRIIASRMNPMGKRPPPLPR